VSFEQQPFLILFLIVFTAWRFVRRRERAVVTLLLSASLLFYAYNHWVLLPILLAYCVLDWYVALRIERSPRPRLWMWVGVGFNLSVLCWYKYTPLLATTFGELLPGVLPPLPANAFEKWSIPYGISFYAFTGIAYVVDVYRKTTPPEPSLWRYSLSAAFFPHLVAGPILRPNEFLDRVRPGHLPTDPDAPGEALWLISRGFFKKLVVADRIGLVIDPFFAHVNDPTTAGIWSLPYVWLYALQIYFDFSAYTDMARGFGLLFGYRWPENFDRPYLATSITDFWRRWHITLSRFLRDYVYISLGGNRRGRFRTHLNLMVTMLLGGLWHGASWSFLVWGGLHGSFLILHKLWSGTRLAEWLNSRAGLALRLWQCVALMLTFHCVCLAWCFFRLTVFADSLACVRKWVEFDPTKMWGGPWCDPAVWLAIGLYLGLLGIAETCRRLATSRGDLQGSFATGAAWGVRFGTLALAVLIAPSGPKSPFIYFQF
jgi:alginate O-acetyltransferase complex protein AlgI